MLFKALHLIIHLVLEQAWVNMLVRLNTLEFSREVGANVNVFSFNFLLKFKQELEDLFVLAICQHVSTLSLAPLVNVSDLNLEEAVHFKFQFALNRISFGFKFIFMGKLLSNSLQINQDFLESFMISGLELLEATAK